eukprot:UN03453
MITALRKQGLDITAEQYPYTAGMTRIDSGVFAPGWQRKLNITAKDVEWALTGERLTEDNFDEHPKKGGTVILHSTPSESLDLCFT